MDLDNWIEFAKLNNYKYILIMKDLEDLELYPVYFYSEKEVQKYKDNIISIMRVKIIQEIEI